MPPWTPTSFFPSTKRCCPQCSQRQITVGGRKVTQYYHRAVVAHLIGFDIPVVLDIEMIRPGEGEIVAARRLFERLLPRYGRFFDAVLGDALYFEAPLFHLCRQHGKHLVAVLKDNHPALLAEAQTLLQGEPNLVRHETQDQRVIRYWDQEGFTTDAIKDSLRVLRTEEHQTQRERIARQWVTTQTTSTWFWATSIPQDLIPTRQLCQIGHQRWKIENRIFNALSQHWGLDHCFHHQPAAIVNFLLTLFIAHTLLACFQQRNLKDPYLRHGSLIGLASQILIGVAAVRAGDITWFRLGNHPPPT